MSSQVVASETTLREKAGQTSFATGFKERLEETPQGGASVGFVYPNKTSLSNLTVIKHSCLLRKAC